MTDAASKTRVRRGMANPLSQGLIGFRAGKANTKSLHALASFSKYWLFEVSAFRSFAEQLIQINIDQSRRTQVKHLEAVGLETIFHQPDLLETQTAR
jgi:hypothetical protein